MVLLHAAVVLAEATLCAVWSAMAAAGSAAGTAAADGAARVTEVAVSSCSAAKFGL